MIQLVLGQHVKVHHSPRLIHFKTFQDTMLQHGDINYYINPIGFVVV